MREEFIIKRKRNKHIRITPAHAGRINTYATAHFRLSDHPRACGKNQSFTEHGIVVGGSPPRMREELYSFWK